MSSLWFSAGPLAADGGGDASLLEVHGDDGCVDAPRLQLRLSRWLDGHAWDAKLRVRVEVTRAAVSFQLLNASGVLAERAFESAPGRCAARLDALSLAIALALEQAPAADGGEAGDSDAPSESPSTPVQPPPAAAPGAAAAANVAADTPTRRAVVPHETESSARVRLALGGGLLAHQSLPLTAAMSAGIESDRGTLAWQGSLLGTLPVTAALSGGSVRTQVAALELRACLQIPAARFALFGCAGCLAGVVFAAGRNFDQNHGVLLPWVAPLIRLGVRSPELAHFSLRLSTDARIDMLRPEFRTRAANTNAGALTLGPLGFGSTLELIYELP